MVNKQYKDIYLTSIKIFYYRNNIMIIFLIIILYLAIALGNSINIYLLYGPKIVDVNINIIISCKFE